MRNALLLLALLASLAAGAAEGLVAAKPLFRDPVYDGAADPVVIWNPHVQRWWMFYTNRRANAMNAPGVTWVHGTRLGIAESTDHGANWRYVGTAEIELPDEFGSTNVTHWAPEIFTAPDGVHHMFLTVVPGVFEDWQHPRSIVHLTSRDLRHWSGAQPLKLASDRVIDACALPLTNGLWRLWYNNERDKKSIYFADSRDFVNWEDQGKAVGDQGGEGPKVFRWQECFWMITDVWRGLAVYRSDDARHWQRQSGGNLLQQPGQGADDQVIGGHPDVVVSGDRAFLFYFTHPGRRGDAARGNGFEQKRSSIQVVELFLKDGKLTCDRDQPTHINLIPPPAATGADDLKFSFGTNPPMSGFTRVSPTQLYAATNGFGFEPGASVTAGSNGVTSNQPFLFSVKLSEGNYRVVVTLGDDLGESVATVKAEARRLMLENVRTARGETVTRAFTVNTRTPRISTNSEVRLKQRELDTEMITWDDRLTLEFNGAHPSVRSLEISPAPAVPTIFIAGDSTVCDQPREPWNSWGQMLPRFFNADVAVANYAQSGESIKSSLSARRFDKIFGLMKPGDWLLVQFGHNDMKDKATNALAVYKTNLKKIVAQTRAKGATPVLITSMERKNGITQDTLAGYPDAVREVAKEDGVALIDLHAMSKMLYRALGPNLDQAFQDGTHHNNYGSYELARCIVEGIRVKAPALAKFLADDAGNFDPAHPDAPDKFKMAVGAAVDTKKPDGN